MKLIIDMPGEVVAAIRNGEDYRYDINTAIAQGIPYDDRTSEVLNLQETIRKLTMDRRRTQMEILNAKITSTSITMAVHGRLTFWVTIEGSGWGVSIGGYSIGHGYLGADKFDGYAPGLEAMMRIMDVVGVDKWEDLKGKYIRVESDGWGGTIKKIGHITDDKWFDIDEFFKSKRKEEKGDN